VTRAVAVTLKIPDNTAYTAAVALRRLGLGVERVERSEIWFFDDGFDPQTLLARVRADERIFNPNKHRAELVDAGAPRSGELWIEEIEPAEGEPRDRGRVRRTGWRLYGPHGVALDRGGLRSAAERLLCNPAIERALF
jgi:hypothetical protein